MEKRDDELVALARSGNREAFGRLIERHHAGAMRSALGLIANEEVARELVQEAMLQAYLSLDRLREDARFPSWLHGIVLNVCRTHLRKRERRCLSWEGLEREPRLAVPAAPDPADLAEQREQERLVLDAVQSLSPPNRDATVMFYYEQLSLQEVAAALGISVGAVKGRLHQSRKQLRERLLPLRPEGKIVLKGRRRRKMVKVTVAYPSPPREEALDREDPVASHVSLGADGGRVARSAGSLPPSVWVGLMEEPGCRFLPLPLGWDARALAGVLAGAATEVSPALALMANLLKATDARLESVRIEPLNDEILQGLIRLSHAGAGREVAAQTGDAMALAVQTDSPIYVAEEIMARAGWDLSDALSVVERLRQTGGETSLGTAADEPFMLRIAQAIIENGLRYLHLHDGCTASEVVLEPYQRDGNRWVTMFHRAAESGNGRSLPMPEWALPAVIVRFKRMAGLSIAEQHAPQQGDTSVQYQGKAYHLRVTTTAQEDLAELPPEYRGKAYDRQVRTVPLEWGERLRLEFQGPVASVVASSR